MARTFDPIELELLWRRLIRVGGPRGDDHADYSSRESFSVVGRDVDPYIAL